MKPSVIVSGNAINLTKPTVKGLLGVLYAIKQSLIVSLDAVNLTKPTVIDLLVDSYRNNSNGDSLREHSKTHTTHRDRSFSGFLMH
jgi:hypothetical protein